MAQLPLRQWASAIFRRPSALLEEINSNAAMVAWSRENETDRIFPHRYELYDFLQTQVIGTGPIDYLEFGVFRGDSILRWAGQNRAPSSRFFGFDSFDGLPEAWSGAREAKKEGHFTTGGAIPATDDPRVRFVKGWFQETLRPFLEDFEPLNRIVLHNDSDLYSSTLYTLTMMDRFLKPGSIIIFDEFYSSSHEFRAFVDYTRSYLRSYRVLGAVSQHPYAQIAFELE